VKVKLDPDLSARASGVNGYEPLDQRLRIEVLATYGRFLIGAFCICITPRAKLAARERRTSGEARRAEAIWVRSTPLSIHDPDSSTRLFISSISRLTVLTVGEVFPDSIFATAG
jgi:hypothetical protein